jgi:hypothetical protein
LGLVHNRFAKLLKVAADIVLGAIVIAIAAIEIIVILRLNLAVYPIFWGVALIECLLAIITIRNTIKRTLIAALIGFIALLSPGIIAHNFNKYEYIQTTFMFYIFVMSAAVVFKAIREDFNFGRIK